MRFLPIAENLAMLGCRSLTVVVSLLAAAAPPAWSAELGGHATAARLEEYLGPPHFAPPQQLWTKRGGWGGILAAPDGTVIAFRSPGGSTCRRSRDGGVTWEEDVEIGAGALEGNALVDEKTGHVLYVNPGPGWLYRSADSGATWSRESIEVERDGFGLAPGTEGVAAMQCGITLASGPHPGRLVVPARIMGPKDSNATRWRPYHYSTAIWSDDGGKHWRTSQPFPVLGTGEGTIAELSDGRLLYNSREHMSRGNRFLAWSHDGGDLWVDAARSPDLPDGPRGSSYGLKGGMIRLPIAGRDILVTSNVDTDAGAMPKEVGGSIGGGRERLTVWASFDGGRTWPVKRLVDPGPSAYSGLGTGRSGTPSQGKIYLIAEGGTADPHAAVRVTVFNLSWLLDGRDIGTLLPDQQP